MCTGAPGYAGTMAEATGVQWSASSVHLQRDAAGGGCTSVQSSLHLRESLQQ